MLSGNGVAIAQSDVEQEAELARKLYEEATALEQKGNYPDALARFEAALKIAEEGEDKRTAAKCWLGIGFIKMVQGDYRTALEFFRKAKKSAEETNDKTILAGALRQIGNIQVQQGRYGEAQESYERALKAGEEGKDKREVSNALIAIGGFILIKATIRRRSTITEER